MEYVTRCYGRHEGSTRCPGDAEVDGLCIDCASEAHAHRVGHYADEMATIVRNGHGNHGAYILQRVAEEAARGDPYPDAICAAMIDALGSAIIEAEKE